ncbi:MAG: class I SAM-dependent methyltransferase [Candidatus Aminicenantes bacterium]|nr:class I SAM-dependent methyltransferase [Candidatus Aminicenantes bacterium]
MKRNWKRFVKTFLYLPVSFFWVLVSDGAWQQKKPEVPYVPTPKKVVSEMLKRAAVRKEDVLYDLGCGDGRIVITAAIELGCRGVGIDIDPKRIEESRKNAIDADVSDRVEFFLMNLFEAEIREATVVTLYLLSEVNLRLRPKLLRELRPGTRVVSHDFNMGAWKPDESVVIDDNSHDDFPIYDTFWLNKYWNKHNVFLWIIPSNVTGVWKGALPEFMGKKRITLELKQAFQEFEGEAFEDSSSIVLYVKNGIIKGNRLEFTLEPEKEGRAEQMHFEGRVSYNTIEGLVRIEGKPDIKGKWKATRDPSTIEHIEK